MESVGGKRKIDEEIELAKQKAQAIAARLISDAGGVVVGDNTKRPRTDAAPDYSSSSALAATAVSYTPMTSSSSSSIPTTQKISIPNAKVGVIIGRGGDMIKNLQARSGARIQITRDNDADPSALTRDVELMGTPDQIARAQHLITETIAEADAASSGNRAPLPPLQSGAQQFVIKVPNDKVALVIGKAGDTIKTMQSTSGARIQVVPLHLPPGDTSTERNVFINGTQDQIDSAKDLLNQVISGNRLKVLSATNAYAQPAYTATSWTPPPAQHPPPYAAYSQPATYTVPPPPYYAGYPPHQTNTPVPPHHHSTGYNTYGHPLPASTPPYNYAQIPSTAAYNYNQPYPQQPLSYGQDVSGQAQPPDQSKPFTNSAYGPPATSGQPDGSAYGGPVVSGQPDGSVAQSQPPSAYAATGYDQPTAAQANGGTAFPTYSGAPLVQPPYGQTGYPQTGYGQQQEGQVANQASYSYYGQTGYPPAQGNYYQDAYTAATPPQAPPQIQPQGTNGLPQPSSYGVEKTDGTAPAADEKEKPQS